MYGRVKKIQTGFRKKFLPTCLLKITHHWKQDVLINTYLIVTILGRAQRWICLTKNLEVIASQRFGRGRNISAFFTENAKNSPRGARTHGGKTDKYQNNGKNYFVCVILKWVFLGRGLLEDLRAKTSFAPIVFTQNLDFQHKKKDVLIQKVFYARMKPAIATIQHTKMGKIKYIRIYKTKANQDIKCLSTL